MHVSHCAMNSTCNSHAVIPQCSLPSMFAACMFFPSLSLSLSLSPSILATGIHLLLSSTCPLSHRHRQSRRRWQPPTGVYCAGKMAPWRLALLYIVYTMSSTCMCVCTCTFMVGVALFTCQHCHNLLYALVYSQSKKIYVHVHVHVSTDCPALSKAKPWTYCPSTIVTCSTCT